MLIDIHCIVFSNICVYLMLTALITKGKSIKQTKHTQKGWEETFRDDGWVYSINSDDGIMGVYLFPDTSSIY